MSQATMLLRSSSTPVLGSLLSSFSDSPNNSSSNHHHDINTTFKHSPIHHQSINKLPYHQTGCFCLSTISCNSSPISPSISEFSGRSHQGFRRAQSEGNLQGLLDYSSNNNDAQHHNPNQTRKVSGRSKCLMLETIPSFSYSTSRGRYEDEDEEDEDQSDVQDEEERAELEENAGAENGHFGLSNKMENMVLTEEVRVMDRIWSVNFEGKREWISEEMHLARGPGIDYGSNGNGGGGGYGGRSGGGSGDEFDSGGGDMHGTGEYYKKMVQENPGNPLFLRNYAQFLYQTKRDLQGAEEYYSRAILADPKDGEILSQYGKLVWELHQDQDRASSYFERGVQASPEDCHVHAAYASFLWETEDDDDDDDVECKVPPKDFDAKPPHFHEGAVAFARGQAVN